MKPSHAHNFGTYFTTTQTWGRRPIFRSEELARLFIRTLYTYAAQRKFLLHDFFVMPDHVHLILTPNGITLERAKGGYSLAVSASGRTALEVWQKGFADHRIRDSADLQLHRRYIWNNPVKKGLCIEAAEYPFSSANARFKLEDVPQRLKPTLLSH
jgi:putative transposase